MLSLCFHLFPLSLYLLNVVVIVINYGLECVTILGLQCVGVFNLGVYTFIGVLHTIRTFKSVGSRSMEGSST